MSCSLICYPVPTTKSQIFRKQKLFKQSLDSKFSAHGLVICMGYRADWMLAPLETQWLIQQSWCSCDTSTRLMAPWAIYRSQSHTKAINTFLKRKVTTFVLRQGLTMKFRQALNSVCSWGWPRTQSDLLASTPSFSTGMTCPGVGLVWHAVPEIEHRSLHLPGRCSDHWAISLDSTLSNLNKKL